MKKFSKVLLVLSFLLGIAVMPLAASAAGEPATASGSSKLEVSHASELAAQMGVLLGDGDGVTDEYLAKNTTRVQGAIITLRLIGKEKEALSFGGTSNFSDASTVGKAIRPVLAYLKEHPELGWNGTGGGKFDPNAAITAQQVYKVMLESLSYRTGDDFAYADAISFAASKGLFRAAAASPFTNRQLAEALIETLQSTPKESMKPLADQLADDGMLAVDKAAMVEGVRIDLRKTADGSVYFTDGKGMALYLFTKDMLDLNTCVGGCLSAWPVFGDNQLLLPDGMDDKDFGLFIRTDGLKQLMYKGWPLYYFAKDKQPGETLGEGVGKVWYLLKQPFYNVAVGTEAKLGNYLVDQKGMALYYFDKDPKDATVCFGECLKAWPAFYVEKPLVPSGLKAEDFGTIIRPDGGKQTTYKGYPLYYWVKDTKRGDTTGQDVGKVWFVVNPEKFDGTTVEKATPARESVEMKGYAFSKTDMTVKAGTFITFTNRDTDKHNFVLVDGSIKTPLLAQGESVTIKIDKPGIYEFFCEPHKDHMKGKITVQ